jgi:hypothetical protein
MDGAEPADGTMSDRSYERRAQPRSHLHRESVAVEHPPGGARPPLRVGVVLDSTEPPRWVHWLLDDLAHAPFAALAAFIVAAPPPSGADARGGLLYPLYARLDRRLFPLHPDPLQSLSLDGREGEGVPLTHATSATRMSLAQEESAAIRDQRLDVLLCLGAALSPQAAAGLARLGALYLRMGGGELPAGVREVLDGVPATRSAVYALRNDGGPPRLAVEAYRKTHKRSAYRTRAELYRKAPGLLLRALRDLHDSGVDGDDGLARDGELPARRDAADFTAGEVHLRLPTDAEMSRGLLKAGGRLLEHARHDAGTFDQWIIGLHLHAGTSHVAYDRLASLAWRTVIPPRDRFWADPFPVRVPGGHVVFVEEYLHERGRAHISAIEVSESGATSAPVPVLEREHHLSYPFILEWHGERFMIPESIGGRTVDAYRATSFPDSWTLEAQLLGDVRAVDATPIEVEGRWWMFAGVAPERHSHPSDWQEELHLFHASSPLGPWTPHRRNPVKTDVRGSRPAGALFWRNGELWRPAQDCSVRYGYAITLHRVLRLNASEFLEEPVARIDPDWTPGLRGTHTVNSSPGLVVLDGRLIRRKRGDRFDRPAASQPAPAMGAWSSIHADAPFGRASAAATAHQVPEVR